MMISNNFQNKTNFNAIPVSKAKIHNGVREYCYDIYQLTKQDSEYLKQLSDNIDMKELYPDLSENGRLTWLDMIKHGLSVNHDIGEKGLLLTENNVPCGVMNYSVKKDKFYVNYVGSWQDSKTETIPAKGTLMFMELFKQFKEEDARVVELSAIRYGPIDVISKYTGPVKLIHGDEDSVVSLSYSERAVKSFKDASLTVMPGAGHGFGEEDSTKARELTIEFIMKQL